MTSLIKNQTRAVPRPRQPSASTSAEATSLDTGQAIASMLVKAGQLTSEQLAYARRVQAKLATPQTLLHILRELKYVTQKQLTEILSANPKAVRLGDLLVELGHLTKADLDIALHLQREMRSAKKIGEILIENRFIGANKLAEVLACQLGIPYVDLQGLEIDKTLVDKDQIKWYAEHSFIPLYKQHGRICVAFSDPLDLKARELAEKRFGGTLLPAVTTASAIHKALAFIKQAQPTMQVTADDDHSAVGIVNALFLDAIRENASDIHIEPMYDRLQVRLRCDGMMTHHKDFALALAPSITSRLKILANADIAEKRRHQDGRILFEDPKMGLTVDMRMSVYITIHGEKIVLRLLNKQGELLDINDIGMAPLMLERFRYDALDVPSGVVIITGPTGSGKTTTLYSCINHLNDAQTSIITAEDPVEYVIDGIAQCSINPKINVTFEETLRHIVRQDPDIIVLGEIRDRFSAETAIQAALTGHKVLTTFHTEDSIGGLLRLLNMDIEAFLISSTVVCVVAQRLLRKVCAHCAETYQPTPLDLRRLGYDKDTLTGFNFKVGRGCHHCRFRGSKGRVGVFELLVLNEKVKDAILNRKTSYEIRRISLESSGLVTLIEDGLIKASRGEITLQEAIRRLPRLHQPRPLQELRRLVGENP